MPIDGGWAMLQGRDNATQNNNTDDLILSRFGPDGGKALETHVVPLGGHGGKAYPVNGQLVTKISDVWSKVRFGEAFKYEKTTAPKLCPLPGPVALQGEAYLGDNRFLRIHGGSIKTDPKWHPGENAWLQVLDGSTEVKRIDLDKVARDAKGNPIGGRYEPEGVTVGVIDGARWVLVGFAVGPLGNTTMRVYGKPLDALITTTTKD